MYQFLISYGLFWTVLSLYFVLAKGIAEYQNQREKGKCPSCAHIDGYIDTANQNLKLMAQNHEELLTTIDSPIKENSQLKKKVGALVGINPNTTVN